MRVLSIILAGLLVGCSDGAKRTGQLPMTEDWQFFPCTMGEDEAFIYVNVGASEVIESAPTALVKFRLTYKSPRPNGLPTQDEFEPVSAIEDRIEAHSKSADDWYVGRVTVGGFRFFYVYTTRSESSWMEFLQELSTDSGYEIRLTYREDPEHKGYRDDLFPTEDDWQVIEDLRVIENLESHGDDLTRPRKVDHWIYFDNKASSIDFVIWAENDRFTAEPQHSHETDDGKYCVRLSHHGTMTIGDISSHTIALRRKAAECGGDYDGWETPVMKSKDNE